MTPSHSTNHDDTPAGRGQPDTPKRVDEHQIFAPDAGAGAIVLAVLVILLVAATRQLNFDESLALHSGWLYVTGSMNGLGFLMPVVLLIGSFAWLIPDPAVVLTGLRFLVVLSMGLVFLAAKIHMKLPLTFFVIWVLFTLSNGAFLTHALEFRYDWAILVSWIGAFILIAGRSQIKYILLGVICAWLLFHHLKGVFYAGWLYLFVMVAIYLDGTVASRTRSWVQLNVSLVAFVTAWILIVLSLGRMEDLINLYIRFFELSREVVVEQSFSHVLYRLQKDAWWWVLSAIGMAFILVSRRHSPEILWAIVFAAVPAVFVVLHPLPWAYLIAPIVPFVAFITVTSIYQLLVWSSRKGAQIRPGLVVVLATLVFLAATLKEAIPQYQDNWLPGTASVLRVIKAHAKAGDTVVDPSGTVYFIQPVHPEWYSDTLFRELAKQELWQKSLEHSVSLADWALNSHRLGWLTDGATVRVQEQMPVVCGPVRMRAEDPRYDTLKEGCEIQHMDQIESNW